MAMSGNPFSMGGNTPFGTFASSIPGFAQSFFGNSGAPFKKAMNAFIPYFQQSQAFQAPYFQGGTAAVPQYSQYLNKMQNPEDFINNIMKNYHQSDRAKYLTDAALRANNNMASAAGLVGSSPWQESGEKYAKDIAEEDIDSWLRDVLGINTQYGQGLGNELNMGQHSADILSELFNQGGRTAGEAAYGQEAGRQSDRNSGWAALGKLFGA